MCMKFTYISWNCLYSDSSSHLFSCDCDNKKQEIVQSQEKRKFTTMATKKKKTFFFLLCLTFHVLLLSMKAQAHQPNLYIRRKQQWREYMWINIAVASLSIYFLNIISKWRAIHFSSSKCEWYVAFFHSLLGCVKHVCFVFAKFIVLKYMYAKFHSYFS